MYTTIKLYVVAEPEIYSLGTCNLFELSVIISFVFPIMAVSLDLTDLERNPKAGGWRSFSLC